MLKFMIIFYLIITIYSNFMLLSLKEQSEFESDLKIGYHTYFESATLCVNFQCSTLGSPSYISHIDLDVLLVSVKLF
jgi:hypothetical protein